MRSIRPGEPAKPAPLVSRRRTRLGEITSFQDILAQPPPQGASLYLLWTKCYYLEFMFQRWFEYGTISLLYFFAGRNCITKLEIPGCDKGTSEDRRANIFCCRTGYDRVRGFHDLRALRISRLTGQRVVRLKQVGVHEGNCRRPDGCLSEARRPARLMVRRAPRQHSRPETKREGLRPRELRGGRSVQ